MTHRQAAAALCVVLASSAAVVWALWPRDEVQRTLARAERGDSEAQYRLGSLYFYGEGVRQDYAEAILWYRRAAAQKSAKAEYAIGYCNGHGLGVPRDDAEAARWMRQAADQGNAAAQCELASMYYRGAGVGQNYSQAFLWYQRAADQGNATGEIGLAYLYGRGEGVTRDDAEAVRWYRKAAEHGDRPAQLILARAYRYGRGTPKDYVQAGRWYLTVIASCSRRLGWSTPIAIGFLLASLLVPRQRWGRAARWAPWALMAIGSGVYLFHIATSRSNCFGLWGALLVAGFGVLSTIGAVSQYVATARQGGSDSTV